MSEQSVEQHTHKRGKNDSEGQCVVAGCTVDRFPMWWRGYEVATAAAQEHERVLVKALQNAVAALYDLVDDLGYCCDDPECPANIAIAALRAVGALENDTSEATARGSEERDGEEME